MNQNSLTKHPILCTVKNNHIQTMSCRAEQDSADKLYYEADVTVSAKTGLSVEAAFSLHVNTTPVTIS